MKNGMNVTTTDGHSTFKHRCLHDKRCRIADNSHLHDKMHNNWQQQLADVKNFSKIKLKVEFELRMPEQPKTSSKGWFKSRTYNTYNRQCMMKLSISTMHEWHSQKKIFWYRQHIAWRIKKWDAMSKINNCGKQT